MHKTILYFICSALVLAGTASAKDYGGIYVLQHQTGAMTLTFHHHPYLPSGLQY